MKENKTLELSSNDIQITKGLAILTMLFLHLFCGVSGKGFMGTPILLLPNGTPFLYYIGWLCAICAPLFCVCNGYAHYKQGEIGGLKRKKVFKRYLKFMSCFALSVLVVSVFGLICGGAIPGSLSNFILNLLALDYTYTSIWWYAWFYVCYVMLSPVFFKWINRVSLKWILLFVLVQFFIVEGLHKKIPEMLAGSLYFKLYDHLYYLFGARMLCYTAGMLLAKYSIFTIFKSKMMHNSVMTSNLGLIVSVILASFLLCILKKGILLIFFAPIVFVWFNLLYKCKWVNVSFEWLGKQSLYIWLLHPFICYSTFPFLRNWLLSFKYSFLIILVLFFSCSIISVILNSISNLLIKQIQKI